MVNLHPAGDPSTRGWGSGWPHCSTAHIVPLTWVDGASPAGGVRTEIARLVTLLGDETIRRGYQPRIGWCWGFDCRPISGTNVPSLHSWGLAVDINAPTNPRQYALHTDMPGWMPTLWNKYGFRWGGNYPAGIAKDPMHYEFMGSLEEAAVATAAAVADLVHHDDPLPLIDGDDEMFMYLDHGGTQAILVEGGKQVALDPTFANALSQQGIKYVRTAASTAMMAALAAKYGPA
jgi:hypothetical protein